MRITIDASGRLVIPKAIREEASLEAGMDLEIRVRDGRVEIEPAPRDVQIVKKGRLAVAVPAASSPPLTSKAVQRAQRALRDDR